MMKRFLVKTFFGLMILLSVACLFSLPVVAEESSGAAELDEALEGFDEDEGSELDDALSGFEDDADEASEEDWESGFEDDAGLEDAGEVPEEASSSRSEFSGALTLSSTYNVSHDAPDPGETDHRGFSRARIELDLELVLRLPKKWKAVINGRGYHDFVYGIRGRHEYTDETLEGYEQEAELFDGYIQGSLMSNLDLKVGRQVVVWGKSDNLRVTDVLNPMDNREPGLVDIEDLRLTVAMARFDLYLGDWNLTALVIPEIRFNKNPAYGSDFYPLELPPPHEEIPVCKPENYEYGLALNGVFSGWDLSFYGARFFEDQYHVDITGVSTTGATIFPEMELRHNDLLMAGMAANVALDAWLLKSEAAYLDGFEYVADKKKKSRMDALVGIEYYGFSDTSIGMEAMIRHIFDFLPEMKAAPDFAREDYFQAALRITRNFFHETLEVTLLASVIGERGQDGSFERFNVKYDVNDSLAITGGVVLYQKGEYLLFENIEDNDRILLEMKYSF